jgi:Fe-S oxidoreductase
VAYSFLNTLAGPWDFLDPNYPVPQHICEFTYNILQEDKDKPDEEKTLKLDKSLNDDMVVTFHDSCNVARATRMGDKPGGQFTIPREVIKAACNNYVEMDPDTTHEKTFCCGGGGGLLTDDLMEVRVKGAMPRMQALNNAIEEHGVTNMAAICAICKAQFTKILPYYGMGMDMIVSVHQLISNALILTGQKTDEDEDEDSVGDAAE